MLIYRPTITIHEIKSLHTALQGEDCTLDSIEIDGNNSTAVMFNSKKHKLYVPLDILKNYFDVFEYKTLDR